MSITAVGSADVMAAPDVVTLALGVEVMRSTAVEAVGAASESALAVLSALSRDGIAPTDMRTTSMDLQHHYVITGGELHANSFSCRTGFTVTIRDIQRVAGLIDTAISAAGDTGRIHSLSYRFADDAELQHRARDEAFADARRKAEQYAQLSGLTLGRALTITEGVVGTHLGRHGIMTVQASANSGMPVSPGEQASTANVTVEFDTSPPAEVN
jgi:uncharacterized protein YggE